jgi:hypothetical protein
VGEEWPALSLRALFWQKLCPLEGTSFPVRRHGPSAISLGCPEECGLRNRVRQPATATANVAQEARDVQGKAHVKGKAKGWVDGGRDLFLGSGK